VLAGLNRRPDREAIKMPLNCLLVDDSEAFLASAARLLSAEGMRIMGYATCAADAIRVAAECLPDIALVDIELGAEDGLELAGRLSAAGSCQEVIMISLRDRGELTERIADCGPPGSCARTGSARRQSRKSWTLGPSPPTWRRHGRCAASPR